MVNLPHYEGVARVYRGAELRYAGGKDGLELVAVSWERWCSIVSGGGGLFVLFEDGFEGWSCLDGGGITGWLC